MKKINYLLLMILFFLILIISVMSLSAQDIENHDTIPTDYYNQVGITFSPEKNGVGIIFITPYNQLFTVEKGAYHYPNEPKVEIIKLGTGLLVYEYTGISKTYVSILYNQVTNFSSLPQEFQDILNDNLKRISIEMTGVVYFNNKIGATISYDFINFEFKGGIIFKI